MTKLLTGPFLAIAVAASAMAATIHVPAEQPTIQESLLKLRTSEGISF